MGLWNDIEDGIQAGGEWLGDVTGAAPSASAPHAASPEAHTAHPEERGLLDSIVHGVGQLGRGLQEEGIGGLLDPFGAIDRQDAQEELASRFNVVAPGTPGAGDQNTVTEEEFQRIARSYSDIRMGRSDIRLDTGGMDADEADEFRARTMSDIGDILQTNSGRDLIDDLSVGALDADGETQRITRIGRAADADSASGGGDWDSAREHKQGFANYVPGENHLPGYLDARSDVTLYHELVHAHHSTNNSWARGPVDEDDLVGSDRGRSIDDAEYQAAGLGTHAGNRFTENAYRRDRMALGRSGSGMRTLGGSDADMAERTFYLNPDEEAEAHHHEH